MTKFLSDDDDDAFRPVSDEERRLVSLFKTALVFSWKEIASDDGGPDAVPSRKMRLDKPHAATRFFEEVLGLGDRGYDIAAYIIAKHMDALERPVRSQLMTRMARAIPDCIMRSQDVQEREISQFGQVIDRLIADFPERFLEWAEDMEADDPWNDLKRQPTAIIRGAFLSPAIDARKTVAFWTLAARSRRFPVRMFSDPSEHPAPPSVFSSFHARRYAMLFSVMEDEALLRFGSHMRMHAVEREVAGTENGVRTVRRERLTRFERVAMLRDILGQIDAPHRRGVAAKALLNAPSFA